MAQIEIQNCSAFELAWNDQGSGANMSGSFYNPVLPAGYYSLGSYSQSNYDKPSGSVGIVRLLEDGAIAFPVDFKLIWNDQGSGANMSGSFWEPVPPKGYVAMGMLCIKGYDKPDPNTVQIVCLRADLTIQAEVGNLLWNDQGSGANANGSFWLINNPPGSIETGTLFAGQVGYDKPTKSPLLHAIAAHTV